MWHSTVREDNINNYGEVYLDLMGNVKVPQGGQKSPLQSYSQCKKTSLWQCRIDKRIMSALHFQNKEQGESRGAAAIRAALGCYAYTGA